VVPKETTENNRKQKGVANICLLTLQFVWSSFLRKRNGHSY